MNGIETRANERRSYLDDGFLTVSMYFFGRRSFYGNDYLTII